MLVSFVRVEASGHSLTGCVLVMTLWGSCVYIPESETLNR